MVVDIELEKAHIELKVLQLYVEVHRYELLSINAEKAEKEIFEALADLYRELAKFYENKLNQF